MDALVSLGLRDALSPVAGLALTSSGVLQYAKDICPRAGCSLRASVSLLVNGSEESSEPVGRVSAEAYLLLALEIVENVAGLDGKGL